MKVLCSWFAEESELAIVRDSLPAGTEVVSPAHRPSMSRFEVGHGHIVELARDADAIMGWVCPRSVMVAAERMKALVWMHAGCDELDFELLKGRGVQVANTRGGNATEVAEQAMALMLGIAKRVAERHQWVQEAHWQPIWHPDYIGAPMHGRTLAVVGLGEIGTRVAKRARAFEMRVIGIRRHPERGGDHVDEVQGIGALREVLAEADYVVLAAPITRETDQMFDAGVIAAFKPGAYLINIARGNIIVEQALHEALTDGRIAGYAADVWWNYTESLPASYHYPIPSRTGLHKLPNVLCSGDQASNVAGVTERHVHMAAESLAAFARAEPMPRSIDLDLGY
jgi:phosphoglycerate dehydrogenase-like enzyme